MTALANMPGKIKATTRLVCAPLALLSSSPARTEISPMPAAPRSRKATEFPNPLSETSTIPKRIEWLTASICMVAPRRNKKPPGKAQASAVKHATRRTSQSIPTIFSLPMKLKRMREQPACWLGQEERLGMQRSTCYPESRTAPPEFQTKSTM